MEKKALHVQDTEDLSSDPEGTRTLDLRRDRPAL